ncbi:hypothetical protein [Mariniflexile sp. AS56]|uniref:hypothetical protein n=1 Tax=Flavobacteriaceae TaxID=49546 RepID=UPI0026F1347A|nr:hypothetical protein [Mariniflexile sp. AS56]MDO7174196.1 hypothetical protein [Mariniflexile sp. AS56]
MKKNKKHKRMANDFSNKISDLINQNYPPEVKANSIRKIIEWFLRGYFKITKDDFKNFHLTKQYYVCRFEENEDLNKRTIITKFNTVYDFFNKWSHEQWDDEQLSATELKKHTKILIDFVGIILSTEISLKENIIIKNAIPVENKPIIDSIFDEEKGEFNPEKTELSRTDKYIEDSNKLALEFITDLNKIGFWKASVKLFNFDLGFDKRPW